MPRINPIIGAAAVVLLLLVALQSKLINGLEETAEQRAIERDQARAEVATLERHLERSRAAVISQQKRIALEQERYSDVQTELKRLKAEDKELAHWSGQRLPAPVANGGLHF